MLSKSSALYSWQKPMPTNQVIKGVCDFINQNIQYGENSILGFPGSSPNNIVSKVHEISIINHANNIGLHTNNECSEVGFQGTQKAECEVIAMVADLLNAHSNDIDGYISPGGTEANIVACWIGRNSNIKKSTAIIGSFLSHYSFAKAANILNIGMHPNKDGSGLHLLGTDRNGHILIQELEKKIEEVAKKNVSNIIIIGNAGTTMLGSVDNIGLMNGVVEKAKKTFLKSDFHFHIDAAFGGFIIPFIEGLPSIGFSNSCVDSITIDPHKTGFTPYGCGIVVARKGLFEKITINAPYIPGDDNTLCGSRSGAIALDCWAVMKKIGKLGYKEKALKFIETTEYIQDKLKGLGVPTFKNDINIVAIKKKFDFLNQKQQFLTHIYNNFPVNESMPFDQRNSSIWNIVVMDHTDKNILDKLFYNISKTKQE